MAKTLNEMTNKLKDSFDEVIDRANSNLGAEKLEHTKSAAELFKAAAMIVQTVAIVEGTEQGTEIAGLRDHMMLLTKAVVELKQASAPKKATTPKAVAAKRTRTIEPLQH